ncbi:hypothetical protein GOBAR_AA17792 [Gossypium barbadense]|uniref:Uncharacterized protein n=1 Tax=Gossypium barbadense TaxID=3634 RepID=A0A2P5XHN5_GOSBA|nr:hypothetical protein GOBAR_AA17792 [Gossypium barbadense]
MGEETITLQARNSGITSNIKGNSPHQSTKTDNMTLQKLSFKEVHEPCFRNDKGHIHEERRLWIEELDEWSAHKPRTCDKLKLCQNEFDTSPNQLKFFSILYCGGVSTETRPSTRACLRPCENRAKDFPNTATIKCHGRATWPWLSLLKQHRRATRLCLTLVVEHVEITQAWGLNTRAWEK